MCRPSCLDRSTLVVDVVNDFQSRPSHPKPKIGIDHRRRLPLILPAGLDASGRDETSVRTRADLTPLSEETSPCYLRRLTLLSEETSTDVVVGRPQVVVHSPFRYPEGATDTYGRHLSGMNKSVHRHTGNPHDRRHLGHRQKLHLRQRRIALGRVLWLSSHWAPSSGTNRAAGFPSGGHSRTCCVHSSVTGGTKARLAFTPSSPVLAHGHAVTTPDLPSQCIPQSPRRSSTGGPPTSNPPGLTGRTLSAAGNQLLIWSPLGATANHTFLTSWPLVAPAFLSPTNR